MSAAARQPVALEAHRRLSVTLTAGEPLERIADALDELAAADGRGEIRRLARSIRQVWPGPEAIDDEAAIAKAWELFVSGKAGTLWAAQLTAAGGDRSGAERLRRKMKAEIDDRLARPRTV